MSEKIWKNRWVCDPAFLGMEPAQMLHRQLDDTFKLREHREDLKNIHTLFRKKVILEPGFEQVFLDISADDYYKLYINGRFITQGPASGYPFRYKYNRLDVTKELKPGENVLGVHVYYQGLVNRACNSGDYRQGMIAELWADGKLVMDDCWKCMRAREYVGVKTVGYDTQFEEAIDNRLKCAGWREPGYDDSNWEEAPRREKDDHVLVMQKTENVVTEPRRAVSTKQIKDGILLDFGEELTGTFYMKARGKAGDTVRILFGEELTDEDEVRSDMRCSCRYEDRLILAEGENELEQFEYKCFRYVQLVTEGDTKLWDFRVDFRHYPFDESFGGFWTGNESVGKVWDICKRAVRNCAQEAFLDCPHREKGQYLGDLLVTGHAFYYLTGDTKLFGKALEDFADSARICKGMMAVAPGNLMQEIGDFSLLFPYEVLLYYRLGSREGKGEFLEKMLPVVLGIEDYFHQFRNRQGLLENVKTKWNLVDWPENLRDDYDFDLPQPVVGDGCHNVINAYYVGMKQCVEEIKRILGMEVRPEADRLKEAFIRTFYKADTGLFVDSSVSSHSSLHANAFPCFFGIMPKGNRIVEFIRKKGFCCGVFTAYFVLFGLVRAGKRDLAYELITNESEHSWMNMVKEGATTAYEAWGKEQKWNTSLCHGWAAAPIPVLMEGWTQEERKILGWRRQECD